MLSGGLFVESISAPAQNLKIGPAETYIPLFTIERNVNRNTVHYDAKLGRDGKLDPKQPVIVYWVMGAEDGRRKELNVVERLKAYGITTQVFGPDETYRVTLAAQKTREIFVTHRGDAVRAEMQIGGHTSYLRRIYVTIHKSLLVETPQYIEMYGVDKATGEERYEKLLP